jgi:Do/DeqQ family serine protease
MKHITSHLLVSALVSLATLGIYHATGIGRQPASSGNPEASNPNFVYNVSDNMPSLAPGEARPMADAPANFTQAAQMATPAVVHIKSSRTVTQTFYDPFYEFFGVKPRQQNSKQMSSGSGVILGADGYIVTNNHVIKDADELEVVLYDNRTYKATVIGTDPSTDLGLIKIDAQNLPVLELANSDQVVVGEWVLAVGNPFSLASTATAGIVSAIGRDLEIIKDQMAIESFIQTDAAVNPGNSGGALVNLSGKLIGVNTAIASPTGAYAGYAFAVPANIVRKVVADLREFGRVQRGFVGVTYARNLNSDLAREFNIPFTEGVLIDGLNANMAAEKAGLRKGDVIVSIDGAAVKSDSKLLEFIARHRPGDILDVRVYRDGGYKNFKVQLTDEQGRTSPSTEARNPVLIELGLDYRDLSREELSRLGLENGVLITRLTAGRIRQQTGLQENFVVLKYNEERLGSAAELTRKLESARGKIRLTGFYPGSNRLLAFEFER